MKKIDDLVSNLIETKKLDSDKDKNLLRIIQRYNTNNKLDQIRVLSYLSKHFSSEKDKEISDKLINLCKDLNLEIPDVKLFAKFLPDPKDYSPENHLFRIYSISDMQELALTCDSTSKFRWIIVAVEFEIEIPGLINGKKIFLNDKENRMFSERSIRDKKIDAVIKKIDPMLDNIFFYHNHSSLYKEVMNLTIKDNKYRFFQKNSLTDLINTEIMNLKQFATFCTNDGDLVQKLALTSAFIEKVTNESGRIHSLGSRHKDIEKIVTKILNPDQKKDFVTKKNKAILDEKVDIELSNKDHKNDPTEDVHDAKENKPETPSRPSRPKR